MFKSEKGITLVALVITIIVLLILAGVTLMLAIGDNGILGRANDARVAQIDAEVKEQIELAFLSARMKVSSYLAANANDTTNVTAAKVALYIDEALDGPTDENTHTGADYVVTEPTASTEGKVTYTGNAYKTATGESAAKIEYTYTYDETTHTLTAGTMTSNATRSSHKPETTTP